MALSPSICHLDVPLERIGCVVEIEDSIVEMRDDVFAEWLRVVVVHHRHEVVSTNVPHKGILISYGCSCVIQCLCREFDH